MLYVIAMVVVIVGVDVLIFRHQAWERLIANVGIVLVFAAFYLRFIRRPRRGTGLPYVWLIGGERRSARREGIGHGASVKPRLVRLGSGGTLPSAVQPIRDGVQSPLPRSTLKPQPGTGGTPTGDRSACCCNCDGVTRLVYVLRRLIPR